MVDAAAASGFELLLAAPELATDNAAMIGFAAALKFSRGVAPSDLSIDINPNLTLAISEAPL
jgi:tRNA A37 threonylcarbamoyltransferase TsaD